MTEKQKELLLKDLCARLPYGVKLECKWKTPAPNGTYGMIITMDSFVLDQICNIDDTDVPFDDIKPYLFPLSSLPLIIEEHEDEFNKIIDCQIQDIESNDIMLSAFVTEMHLYNKYHIDYNNLIPMGLAIDATGKNIY